MCIDNEQEDFEQEDLQDILSEFYPHSNDDRLDCIDIEIDISSVNQ